MLRVAVLEREDVAKNIVFEFGKHVDIEWCFHHMVKMSEFSKAVQEMPFQVVFLNEKFNVSRVNESFVIPYQKTMFIYVMDESLPVDFGSLFARILYIDRKNIKAEMVRILPQIMAFLTTQDDYLISFHDLQIPMKIHDIYYIEKDLKYVVYHTRKGDFQERKTLKELWPILECYNFLWIHASYLVNMEYILKITNSTVCLKNVELPLARARKQEVLARLRGNTR